MGCGAALIAPHAHHLLGTPQQGRFQAPFLRLPHHCAAGRGLKALDKAVPWCNTGNKCVLLRTSPLWSTGGCTSHVDDTTMDVDDTTMHVDDTTIHGMQRPHLMHSIQEGVAVARG